VKASKQVVLAKILFTYELARRLEESGVSALIVCPGPNRTNLASHYPWYVRWIASWQMRKTKPPEVGGGYIVQLATDPGYDGMSGKYFAERKESQSSPESYRVDDAKHLWEVSERLVGQSFELPRESLVSAAAMRTWPG
jgi:retinol dehydrogenase-14